MLAGQERREDLQRCQRTRLRDASLARSAIGVLQTLRQGSPTNADQKRCPMNAPHIAALYRYPIKGMTPEPMTRVRLAAGGTMPHDRAFAIENGPWRFDADAPRHLPKINFLMLMRNERLASLEARFEDATHTLTIFRAGRQVARGQLDTPLGRRLIEQFLAAFMKTDLRGAPRIVSAAGHSFSDVAVKCLHVVNLASVRELERVAGRPVDPLRFRANVHLDGLPAFAELGWVGREFQLGDVTTRVVDRTVRCEATNVDPTTAARDMAIPALLQRTWGRSDFGVYATVETAGEIAVGDTANVLAS